MRARVTGGGQPPADSSHMRQGGEEARTYAAAGKSSNRHRNTALEHSSRAAGPPLARRWPAAGVGGHAQPHVQMS